jgi:hypothetical protein
MSSDRRGRCGSVFSRIPTAPVTTSSLRKIWAFRRSVRRLLPQRALHLMYLYHRNGSGFCWGHISSLDLVHWRHHPDAIGPGNGDEGCFSGGAFVDEDGTAYLSYWDLGRGRGICLASSRDPHFDTWTKLESNPVIRSTEFGITEVRLTMARAISTVPPVRPTLEERRALLSAHGKSARI